MLMTAGASEHFSVVVRAHALLHGLPRLSRLHSRLLSEYVQPNNSPITPATLAVSSSIHTNLNVRKLNNETKSASVPGSNKKQLQGLLNVHIAKATNFSNSYPLQML